MTNAWRETTRVDSVVSIIREDTPAHVLLASLLTTITGHAQVKLRYFEHFLKLITYLYLSVPYKALTFSFHSIQFDLLPRLPSSCLHFTFNHSPPCSFGRPTFFLLLGLHSNAATQCSSLSFLIIWSIQFNLRLPISSLALFPPFSKTHIPKKLY